MANTFHSPWHPHTPPVTADDLRQCPILILHYWAIWNMHDRAMDDLLLPLQREYAGRICFRSCDVDRAENQHFIHGIANIPALGCFVAGKWLKSVVGMRPPTQLRSICDELLVTAFAPTSSAANNRFDHLVSAIRRLLSRSDRRN